MPNNHNLNNSLQHHHLFVSSDIGGRGQDMKVEKLLLPSLHSPDWGQPHPDHGQDCQDVVQDDGQDDHDGETIKRLLPGEWCCAKYSCPAPPIPSDPQPESHILKYKYFFMLWVSVKGGFSGPSWFYIYPFRGDLVKSLVNCVGFQLAG